MRPFCMLILSVGFVLLLAAGVSAQDSGNALAEAIKTYEGIMADPAASDQAKVEARIKRITALSRDVSRRADYIKAAEACVASQAVQLDRKTSILGQLTNVHYSDHAWDNVAGCLRKNAELPGLAPARKAVLLLQLGDIHWRKRHNLKESLATFREIDTIPDVPAKTKQDAETWIRMLTERD
jgi:hypothetical protein